MVLSVLSLASIRQDLGWAKTNSQLKAYPVLHRSRPVANMSRLPAKTHAFAMRSPIMCKCHHRSIVYIINSCKYYNPNKHAQNA